MALSNKNIIKKILRSITQDNLIEGNGIILDKDKQTGNVTISCRDIVERNNISTGYIDILQETNSVDFTEVIDATNIDDIILFLDGLKLSKTKHYSVSDNIISFTFNLDKNSELSFILF